MTIINTVAGSSAKLAQKEVVPTSFPTVVEPPEGYDGLSKATVDAPDNLSAENIKKGVDIAGVVGGYAPKLNPLIVTPVIFPAVVEPLEGWDGLSEVTVLTPDNLYPMNIKRGVDIAGTVGEYKGTLQLKQCTPTQFPTKVLPDEGYDGMDEVTVYVPENLTYDNIKKGVTIAGITGTYAPKLQPQSATPTQFPVILRPDEGYDGLSYASVFKPDNLTPENIKAGVSVAGVVGTYTGFALDTTGGVRVPSNITPDMFPEGTVVIGTYAFFRWSVESIILKEGVKTLEEHAMQQVSELKTVTLPSTLTTISGYVLQGCNMLQSVTVLAPNPPTLAYTAISDGDTLTSIIVPSGSLEAYKASTNWARYGDKLVEASE